MNREQRILSALLDDKTAYNSIIALRSEQDFSEQGWLLVQEIDSFYDTDPQATKVDRNIIKDRIIRKFPKAAKILNTVIDDLQPVSVANTVEEYVELKKQALEHMIADKMLAGEDYSDLLEKLIAVTVVEELDNDTTFIEESLDSILEVLSPEKLIKVAPKSLNDRLDGGLVPGSQVAIYAPTEVGKSMISINLACGFLRDGRRVLYCGNEDPSKAMLLRFFSNLSNMTKKEIIENRGRATKAAYDNGYRNLIFKELTPGSLREIRSLVEKYEPDVVFVDQMANMECRSSSKVEKNEILAVGLRAIAKKYDVVTVIIHQASDDAYGRNILEKNHMYYSNVGVQGQMDVMIGIGMDASYEQQNLRMLCLTKNKLSGNHDHFPVRVVPELSKVVE